MIKRYRPRQSRDRLVISFSGGETSAYMTQWILTNMRDQFKEIAIIFANTGQEDEGTYEFIRKCDEHFGFGTVWIEAVTRHNERKSPGFRVVDFNTASRDGVPFESSIQKYGIPNPTFKSCTSRLKRRPIEAYIRDHLEWERGTYAHAIGIRIDEADRQSSEAAELSLIYPLIHDHPTTKPQINSWWAKQPFRLDIPSYRGNCIWCWKKSLRKLMTVASETPEVFDFPRRMEEQYGLQGSEFSEESRTKKGPLPEGYRRVFYRGNMSTEQLLEHYEKNKDSFSPAADERLKMAKADLFAMFDEELDTGGGCEESCEVYSDEDMAEDAE